jgi:hypothetical protein
MADVAEIVDLFVARVERYQEAMAARLVREALEQAHAELAREEEPARPRRARKRRPALERKPARKVSVGAVPGVVEVLRARALGRAKARAVAVERRQAAPEASPGPRGDDPWPEAALLRELVGRPRAALVEVMSDAPAAPAVVPVPAPPAAAPPLLMTHSTPAAAVAPLLDPVAEASRCAVPAAPAAPESVGIAALEPVERDPGPPAAPVDAVAAPPARAELLTTTAPEVEQVGSLWVVRWRSGRCTRMETGFRSRQDAETFAASRSSTPATSPPPVLIGPGNGARAAAIASRSGAANDVAPALDLVPEVPAVEVRRPAPAVSDGPFEFPRDQLDRLQRGTRRVVELRLEGLHVREIAARLGRSLPGVQAELARALRRPKNAQHATLLARAERQIALRARGAELAAPVDAPAESPGPEPEAAPSADDDTDFSEFLDPATDPAEETPARRVHCGLCSKPGHTAPSCPLRPPPAPKDVPPGEPYVDPLKVCGTCGLRGRHECLERDVTTYARSGLSTSGL